MTTCPFWNYHDCYYNWWWSHEHIQVQVHTSSSSPFPVCIFNFSQRTCGATFHLYFILDDTNCTWWNKLPLILFEYPLKERVHANWQVRFCLSQSVIKFVELGFILNLFILKSLDKQTLKSILKRNLCIPWSLFGSTPNIVNCILTFTIPKTQQE